MKQILKTAIRAFIGFVVSGAFLYATWPVYGAIVTRPFGTKPYGLTELFVSVIMAVFVAFFGILAWQLGFSFGGANLKRARCAVRREQKGAN
ncbi:hypothetical protein LMG22037_05928 [Paraburkholderia phenoliruptrix]|uniref:Uncharacterized protein n=1 Tax=Paraburkholderia phenoliruptrix TaxID=252970 RepID=A0A6J5CIP3_9BURK|nr:hypothetical protein [Paraburkholderia phenoliruptrix]CAB3735060.1 hypothetical protein LMG22037_05928 [Paraburkholderia phenoliruptrix]